MSAHSIRKAPAIAAAGLCLALLAFAPAAAQDGGRAAAGGTAPAAASAGPRSADARQVMSWVARTGDNRGMPFVIVDKGDTRVFVFDGQGRLLGATSALLGLARGDDSAAGIGQRKLADIPPEQRTTPAGRFVASLGRGLPDKDLLWVDYDTALAIHRVLAANTAEHRLQRLASASPLSHRITFGCINVPARFYDDVVRPAFTGTSGIVYILPETRTVAEVFFNSNS